MTSLQISVGVFTNVLGLRVYTAPDVTFDTVIENDSS